MRYFIAAPGGLASGGPELLHQLCCELTGLGYEAKMLYYYMDEEPHGDPVHPNYRMYHNSYVLDTDTVDCADACLIVPEPVSLLILGQMHSCKKVIWWLSVDFFYEYNTLQDGMRLKEMDLVHLVQCRYARSILENIFGVPGVRIRDLSDYLRPEFLEEAGKTVMAGLKQNQVAYNPKKGMEVTQHLIGRAEKAGPGGALREPIRFVPLIHMTPAQVRDTLRRSMVYIDFGNHPGKDRIPREAAVSGCCVITGRKGSAAYEQDLPIPAEYKFRDGIGEADRILALIESIFQQYEAHSRDFDGYRSVIFGEKQRFEENVRNIFREIEEGRF